MNAITRTISSRADLAFTCRDETGRLLNWHVPHDHKASWGVGKKVGTCMFGEVEVLATIDELEAFHAITFAMNNPGWQPIGWGIEGGFSDALAALAIVGMRAVRNGAERFDFQAEYQRRLEIEVAESREAARVLDARVRLAAKNAGLKASRSRRKLGARNRGGYKLVVAATNNLAAGEHFDLSATDVFAYCEGTGRGAP